MGWTKRIIATQSEKQYQIDGFSSLGFESSYQSRTLGTAFLVYLMVSLGFVFIIALTPFSNIRYVGNARNKLINYLCWNKVLRIIMQTSLELIFCSYFTLNYAFYDGGICAFINIFYAVLFAALITGFPIFTAIFYRIKFPHFRKIEFINQGNQELVHHSTIITYRKDNLLWREKFDELINILEDKNTGKFIQKLLESAKNGDKTCKLPDIS